MLKKLKANHNRIKIPCSLLIQLDKHVFLKKQGGRIKSWKERVFVIHYNFLYYFASINDESPKGWINLNNATISMIGNNRIEILVKKNLKSKRARYLLQTPSEVIADEWFKLLTSAANNPPIMDVIHQGHLYKLGSLKSFYRDVYMRKQERENGIIDTLYCEGGSFITIQERDGAISGRKKNISICTNGSLSSFVEESAKGVIILHKNCSCEHIPTPMQESENIYNEEALHSTYYKMKIITHDYQRVLRHYLFKSRDRDVIHQWVYVIQKAIVENWVQNQRILRIENRDGEGGKLLKKAIKQERKNWERTEEKIHYHPLKILLAGSIPFQVGSLLLDFPIDIEGEGKVCLNGTNEEPVLTIRSNNIKLKNLTIRHRGYDDVSAVYIEKGNALLENMSIATEGNCVYVERTAECFIGDSIMHNSLVGIWVSGKAHATVENCLITKNRDGIYVDREGTIRVSISTEKKTQNTQLIRNKISSNSIGIRAKSMALNLSMSDNYISRNTKQDLCGNVDLNLQEKGNVVQPTSPKETNLINFFEEENLTQM